MPAHRVPRVQLVCAYQPCASPFEVTPGDADRVRYCSPTCRSLARQQPRSFPMMLACAYEPCNKTFAVLPHQAKVWKYCSTECYHAARLTQTHEAFAARFWSKVAVCEHGRTCTECCWPWIGATHANGYGNFRATPYKEGNVSAHIVSWFLRESTWPPDGVFVCHTCDVPLCVQNNAHLFLGTHTENMQDMLAKGRGGMQTKPERFMEGLKRWIEEHPTRPQTSGDRNGMRLHPEAVLRGDKSPVMKVTEAQAEEAAQLFATGQWTYMQLGKRYGVTGPGIRYRIRQHKPS